MLTSSLSKKISTYFSFVVLLIIINSCFFLFITYKNGTNLDDISNQLSNTISTLSEIKKVANDSKKHLTNYVLLERNQSKKKKLKVIHQSTYPALKKRLVQLPDHSEKTKVLARKIDVMVQNQKYIISEFEAGNVVTYQKMVDMGSMLKIDELITTLDQITLEKNEELKAKIVEAKSLPYTIMYIVLILTVLVIVLAVFATINLSNLIISTTDYVKNNILSLSRGQIPETVSSARLNEFNGLAEAMDALILSMNKYTDFAVDIARGNLDTDFSITNEHDQLGNGLLILKDNIKNIINETNDAVDQGKLSARISLVNKEGAWKDLSQSINNLFDSIAEPVLQINKIVNAMANGDLTLRYTGKAKGDLSDMTKNLNAALDNIDGLLHQISSNVNVIEESSTYMKQSSEEMSYNTGEIATSIAEMSNGAQAQVAKVDESSGLIEAIITSSNEVRDKAENIKSVAKKGNESSEKGMDMANQVVASMEEISEYAEKTNESINVLTERSREIHRVLSVITDIASQTNLLALNAAIEAAQAGDAGRGFAVVAEEIRKLAEDSRKSASEIEKLVANVQNDTEDAAKAIQIMNKSVKKGEDTSRHATKAFEIIYGTSSETLEFSEEIYKSAISQLDQVDRVVSITESIVVIAEQTAAGTEEVAASASELSTGMDLYYQKTIELTQVAESFKDGISMVRLSGDANENTAIFKMKEAYEKEKNLLDSLLNNIPDRIYFKDLDSKYIRISTSVMKVENVNSRKDILGKSDFDFFNEHAQKSHADEQEIIKTGQPKLNIIEEIKKKDGSMVYLSTTKLPLTGIDGQVIGTFGVSRDITEIKLVEIQKSQLAKEAQKSLKLVERHNTFIGGVLNEFTAKVEVKAPDGTFYLVNKSVAEDYDHSVEDILGKDDSAFFDKAIADKYWSEEKKIIEKREPAISLEKVVINNEDKYWFIRKIPVFIPEYEDWGILGVQREIDKFQLDQKGYIDGLKNKYPNILIDID